MSLSINTSTFPSSVFPTANKKSPTNPNLLIETILSLTTFSAVNVVSFKFKNVDTIAPSIVWLLELSTVIWASLRADVTLVTVKTPLLDDSSAPDIIIFTGKLLSKKHNVYSLLPSGPWPISPVLPFALILAPLTPIGSSASK